LAAAVKTSKPSFSMASSLGDPKLGVLSPSIKKDELLRLYVEREVRFGSRVRTISRL
jgi:hypothetical protein